MGRLLQRGLIRKIQVIVEAQGEKDIKLYPSIKNKSTVFYHRTSQRPAVCCVCVAAFAGGDLCVMFILQIPSLILF